MIPRKAPGLEAGIGILTGVLLCAVMAGASLQRAAAAATNTVSPRDYSAFKIINDRNIFNSRRSARTLPGESRTNSVPAARTESFALVGTMKYEKGFFAFFDGSASEYRKVLKPEDTISGFKIKEVRPSSVILQSATNEIELKVGLQLSRAEKGEWKLSQRPESLEVASASSSSRRDFPSNDSSRRSQRSDRRGDNNNNNSNAPGDGPAIVDQILSALDGPGDQRRPGVTNAPAASAAGGETNMLEILRRRREQE